MVIRCGVALVGILLWSGLALAQTFQIDAVAIEGNRRVELGSIKAAIQAKGGETLSAEAIDRDLRAIFALSRFKDVEAAVEQRNGQNVLVFRVVERPLLRSVKYTGYDELSEEKLKTLTGIPIPSLYDPKVVATSIEAIKKAYTEEGYFAAAITPQLEVTEDNEATLTLAITEGEQVLIDAIRFEGNTVFSDSELRKFMETKERWFLSWMTGRGTLQEDVLDKDLEVLADHYFDQGYVQVKIKKPQITLVDDNRYMDVLIEIEEGQQFRIGTLDVKGDLIKDKAELLALVKFKSGDVFSRKTLREGVLAINDLYADDGYAYVNVSPLSNLDLEHHTLDLVFEIEQGVQVTIDRIRITGNGKTLDKVIRREMKLAEGDLFSASKLKESRRLVNNLGFFEEVNVATAKGSDPEHLNLNVEVKERPTGTFSLGFGYSSIDQFVAQGSVTQENFLGRAWKMNLSGSFGGKSTTYQVGLYDPHFLDTDLALGFDLYNTDREWSEFSKKAVGGDVKVGYPLADKVRTNLTYKYEQKNIYDVDPGASLLVRDQEGYSTLSSIAGSLVRDTTDYRLDPTTGTVSSLSAEFAGLGGTQKFASYLADYRYFYPLPWSVVFSVHGQFGFLQKVGGEEIPVDERLFLGGLHSLRGFKPRQVGPRVRTTSSVLDADGLPVEYSSDYEYIGGNKSAFGNLEWTFPLLPDAGIKGVVFYDFGNAWGEGQQYFSDMRHSYGAGIRWFSPLGPLRLEWGYNLSPREGERHSDLQFSIGTFF